jgi:hypothetical protein
MPTPGLTRERWKARECPGGLGRAGCEHRVQPLGRALRQDCLDEVTAVHRAAIPHDHHAARYLAQQMLKNGDDVCRDDAWQEARMFQAETLTRVPQGPRVAGLLCQRGLSVVLQ